MKFTDIFVKSQMWYSVFHPWFTLWWAYFIHPIQKTTVFYQLLLLKTRDCIQYLMCLIGMLLLFFLNLECCFFFLFGILSFLFHILGKLQRYWSKKQVSHLDFTVYRKSKTVWKHNTIYFSRCSLWTANFSDNWVWYTSLNTEMLGLTSRSTSTLSKCIEMGGLRTLSLPWCVWSHHSVNPADPSTETCFCYFLGWLWTSNTEVWEASYGPASVLLSILGSMDYFVKWEIAGVPFTLVNGQLPNISAERRSRVPRTRATFFSRPCLG